MTGRRPDTIHVWDLATHVRNAIPDVITLPQHFKNHGYHTSGIGKLYHGNGPPAYDPPSWSVDPVLDTNREARLRYALPRNLAGTGLKREASEAADVPDNQYIDGMVTDAAVSSLKKLQKENRPFFLAVGFRKPHLPFNAPQKYWDLYQREDIPLPSTMAHPTDAPELATRSWRELEGYTDIPRDGKLTIDMVRRLRHGYYACISYIDTQIGQLLDTLDQLDLTQNTVIVLWGDHGFHIGEQGLWAKANNFELSTRVPLMIAVPNQKRAGAIADGFVEFVDVYPTLADICGLEAPAGVEGISLKPLIENPERPWKKAAFSQYPRKRTGHRHESHGEIMGYAIRTERYRYIEWARMGFAQHP